MEPHASACMSTARCECVLGPKHARLGRGGKGGNERVSDRIMIAFKQTIKRENDAQCALDGYERCRQQ